MTPSIGGVPQSPQAFNSTATSANVTGLTNGQTYTFRVTASNANGAGPPSDPTAPIVVGVPAAAGTPSAVPGNGSAVVTWSAPGATNGSPVTGYTVTPYWGTTPLTAHTFASTATTQTITGLANGLTLTFQVAARNANGTGVASVAVTGDRDRRARRALRRARVARQRCGRGLLVRAAVGQRRGADGIRGRVVRGRRLPVGPVLRLDRDHADRGRPGQRQDLRVPGGRVQRRGIGPVSAAPGATVNIGAPKAIAPPVATPGNGAATLTWNAAVDNGSPVTQYVVTPYLAGVQQSAQVFASSATTESVTGLANGASYTFTVTAGNARGPGPTSLASAATVTGSPLAPTAVSATAGNANAVVKWVAPGNNGAAVTAYVVTPYLAGVAQPVRTYASPATTQTVTGLANAKTYTFRVAATNSRGTGAQSAASNAVTVGAPGAPSAVVATAGPKRATLHWNAPTVTNGAAVSAYIVIAYIGTVAQTFVTTNSAATTATLTGLGTGKSYTFTVAAKNARGSGPPSAKSNTVKPT